ncbi:MAG TPA: hypothetical protein VLQ48_02735 [Chloroflexia bacterium]|nr:hypothetical protein [Chloroflexia bacterium]
MRTLGTYVPPITNRPIASGSGGSEHGVVEPKTADELRKEVGLDQN